MDQNDDKGTRSGSDEEPRPRANGSGSTGAGREGREEPQVIPDFHFPTAGRGGTPQLPDLRKWLRPGRIIAALVVLFVIFGLGWVNWLATVITDYGWYTDLGHTNVFWVNALSPWIVGFAFAVVFFVIVYVNVRIARALAPKVRLAGPSAGDPAWMQAVSQVREFGSKWLGWALLALCLVLAWIAGAGMSGDWQLFQAALHASSFHMNDPQFGLDIGFFVFWLPALRAAVDWLSGSLIVVLIVTAAVHLLDGAIRPWNKGNVFAPHVKAHLSVLAGLWFFVTAASTYLQTYELDFSARGQVVGATYTDVHASLPALYILTVVAVVVGLIFIANIRSRGWRLPIVALAVWVGASILVGGLFPWAMQTFVVAPNEVTLEAPYIKRNIDMTREAFGLTDVIGRPFAATEDLSATQLVANKDTLDNVRLWGPAVVKQTYQQLQGLRPYYEFKDVDIDRYAMHHSGQPESTATLPPGTVNGNGFATPKQEVLVSARELNTTNLADRAQTWVNTHLVYTHGYGVCMSPVNQSSAQGLPNFIIRDVPPRSTEISVTQPGVYFGEDERDYVVVDTNLKEFDYPLGNANAQTLFSGKTGVPIGGVFGRILFWLRYNASDFLFSGYLKPTSRVLFNRGIQERIGMLANWLTLDKDPYITVIGGRLVWIVDGYTTTSYFPYSEPANGQSYNYIRNSVKCTVDAYDGTTHIYAFDPKDPVLQTWGKIYPGLLTPMSAMPAETRAHLRYPEGLFSVQADVYTTYHMTDPRVFYNKEDQWSLPGEAAGSPMAPFYVLMRLPNETKEDFILMVPFTPVGKDNMIGWMAAKSDPANYGERVVYQFPKQRLTLGPNQVSARLNQDPVISPQLSLWNQRGSSVIYGNMLVIPIRNSIVYVQPLYLQAEQTAIPELTRVIVSYADKVVMEPDLETALVKIFGPQAAAAVPAGTGGGAGTPVTQTGGPNQATPSGATTGTGGGAAATSDAVLANQLFQRAQAALKAGDFATYGSLIQQLGVVLNRLAAPASSASTSTTGP